MKYLNTAYENEFLNNVVENILNYYDVRHLVEKIEIGNTALLRQLGGDVRACVTPNDVNADMIDIHIKKRHVDDEVENLKHFIFFTLHEVRHIVQSENTPEIFEGFQNIMQLNNDVDAYLAQPAELDANRFAEAGLPLWVLRVQATLEKYNEEAA